MSSPSDPGHLPAPTPPPDPLPPASVSGSSSSSATHKASAPKPKSPITTAPSPSPPKPKRKPKPPSRNAAAIPVTAATVSRSSPAATSSAPEDYTPRMDMEFDSEQQAYEFYRHYAFKVGFSVRKRYTNKSRKTGEVTSCKLACSREGHKQQQSSAATKPHNGAAIFLTESRTGCNAHLIIRRNNPGDRFQVNAFQPRHNHPLFAPPRGVPSPFHFHDAPVPPPDFPNGDAGVCAVGEGPLRTRRQWEMKYGEAAALLNYLQQQSLADPAFHHAVQLDVEDKVANVFWVDARMVIDYGQFGDVVAFDVVCRNSISLRHLASFVGCNNFGEPVVFGLALMYDETCESFQWLFQRFLHAMSRQAPRTFFSHQDAVIAKALSVVMPSTSHVICTSHIKHGATWNVNHLAKGHCDFINEFKACISKYDEEAEFLAAWDAMISKYDLRGNVWLQKLFEEKQKWARPYAKGIFIAGMKGTQLNERLNSDVRDHLKAEVDIVLFLKHLQKVINDRRYKELEVEYNSRLKLPYFKIRAPVLIQASEVYTSVIFQFLQEEFEEFQSAYIVNRDESGPCREYVVSIVEKEERYTVYGNSTEQTVSCSCRKFETIGFLCSHALKILDAMDIKYIPDRYIMKRWTKYARCLNSPEVLGQEVQVEKSLEISNRYQYMCPKYVRLVSRASECEESCRVLDQFWGELSDKVEEILQKQTSIGTSVRQPDVQSLKIALSSITKGAESENVLDKSSSTAAKVLKRKDQKSKNHPRNCIEKGLRKKQKVHSEEPTVQYAFLDASAQSGNAMFQDLEAPPNMSQMGSQTPSYKAYMGTGLSSPMGTINYEEMHSGASPAFSLELDFVDCHTSQVSSDSQHNQGL
ncbi:protein FAR1-RELATED SEQUENCE 12-like isoform X2 [Lolium rigidum]|uniref:protein FAR1-RELATED SEQUENCE 12-like isoform X2 n=1 Tax=Lolium rigidum TaxID=89674 RepID=UPI001F5DAEF7|nr:protein FAR1-RELATED SEQUENCE 12-like isoform X2 [Lolium rigidum]